MDLTNENEQLEAELTEEERVIAYATEEIELFEIPLGAYFSNEVSHHAVRSVVLKKLYSLIDELETAKKANEINVNNMIEDLKNMQTELDSRDTEISSFKQENFELKLVIEDRESKLKNCYNELSEARGTIESLTAKLTEATAPKTPTRTNLDGGVELKSEKRAIYNVEKKGRNKFTAIYADNNEPFEDYDIYKSNRYQEVTEEDASKFRIQEPIPADDQRSSEVEEQPVVIPSVDDEPSENTFREEEETIGSELAIESPSVVGSFITEERINSIETRLARVEGMLRI